MLKGYVTPGDLGLVLLLLILSAASFTVVHSFTNGGKHVVVEVDGRHAMELSLDRNVTTSVQGPEGETSIRIENGTVRVLASPCPHKYCVRMGTISRRGEIIVCVPNRVFITIRGGKSDDATALDGVTQ